MKKAILIHGWGNKQEFYDPKYPTPSNSHWFPWLSKQLMIHDIHAIAIEMPNSYYPEYEIWEKELERFELDPDTILIGHSCGSGFIVRYLSENDIRVGKVFLVAPWMGIISANSKQPETSFTETFFNVQIDRNLATKTRGVTLIESTNDARPVQESVKVLKASIDNLNIITIENAGHFTALDGYSKFPKLLTEILK